MREIVLDTETTGLDPLNGDRIVEIGCVELINHLPTGEHRHYYLNPERAMSADAQYVHGLTGAFLADKPVFAAVAGELLDFIGESPLVAHNASFDVGFLNAELRRLGLGALRNRIVDTLAHAKRCYPGAQSSLDALCRRFGIDNSNRTLHGALLDARLLAEVWLEMRGGREPGLTLIAQPGAEESADIVIVRPFRPPRPHAATPEELAAHAAFLSTLSTPIWLVP